MAEIESESRTEQNSRRRTFGALVFVLCSLLIGTWGSVQFTTDYLLRKNATTEARDWARYLASNVRDLEHVAAGEQPSAASMAFLESTRRAPQVFGYTIFNPDGYSQLVATRERIALVDLSDFSSEAALSASTGEQIVDFKQSATPDLPQYFSIAFMPVIADGRTIAVVAAYVDQTEQRDTFYYTFLASAAGLCLLIALSFGVPALAWLRRTREKNQADRRIRFLAHHDSLTGLANRARLKEQLDAALMMCTSEQGVAVHFIDCDRFKEINDTLGHDGGDKVLATIADRLRDLVRAHDMVARLGGDEFVVVQTDVVTKAQAGSLADRIAASVSEPIGFKGQQISVTVSLGVAIAPRDGASAERLLKSSDLALYRSKADGRNCVRFFEPEMDVALQARLELEKAIRRAVREDGFTLHYQPLYQVNDGKLVGFEALIRLPQPDGTIIPPATFIPVAEEMRLIDKIGAWVLREACRAAASWPSHLKVAVNLSPAQFSAGSVSSIVQEALDQAKLNPSQLELEITESLLMSDSEAVMAELWSLKKMGVAIVMDDFGTGYSSLGYLLRFPFDKLKIDQSFMRDFGTAGSGAQAVVKAIIALGRELQLRVTVEGVETAEQDAFLDAAAGDQAQGFYYGRPVPATELAPIVLADVARAEHAIPANADPQRRRFMAAS
jgi:diguanylate cyclase (GGDEF)-like protein